MKHWEKILKRASKADKDRLARVVLMLEKKELPANTAKLTDRDSYRIRVGNWRIKFHYEDDIVIIDDIDRRNENTYK